MDDGVRKRYVGDTSPLISDPGEGEEDGAIERLSAGNVLIIPYTVLQELDHLKEGQSEKNRAAREVIRRLFKYRDGHPNDTLRAGIPMKEDGLLVFADPPDRSEWWDGYDPRNMDDGIILVARRYQKLYPGDRVVLITKDIAMSLRAAKLGVRETMTLESERPPIKKGLYTGLVRIPIPDQERGFLTELHQAQQMGIEKLGNLTKVPTLYPNQCCEIVTHDGSHSAYAVYKNGGGNFLRVVSTSRNGGGKKGIHPRNAEQALALDLLADPDIKLLTLSGRTGSGKTTLALAAGYEFLKRGMFSSMLVYRATVEAGQKMGFLPGDVDEKFAPFTQPIIDNMRVVIAHDGAGWNNRIPFQREERRFANLRQMMAPGPDEDGPAALEIGPFNWLRGRSLGNAFIIIDDAQNLTRKEMKLVLTRPCDNSRVVLTGDPNQVDLPDEDEVSNGFSQVIERWKGEDQFAHLSLPKVVRGWLAETADRLL